MPGDSFDCMTRSVGVTGIYWETRDASKHPMMHRTASTTMNHPAQDTSSPKIKKRQLGLTSSFPEYLD